MRISAQRLSYWKVEAGLGKTLPPDKSAIIQALGYSVPSSHISDAALAEEPLQNDPDPVLGRMVTPGRPASQIPASSALLLKATMSLKSSPPQSDA